MTDLLTILKGLGDESRLRLVALLREGGERPVNELAEILGQSQPRVSHHLRLLTQAGIIERQPEGAFVFYRLAQSKAGRLALSLINDHGDGLLKDNDRDLLNQFIARQNESAREYFDDHASEWDHLRAGHIDETVLHKHIINFAKTYGPFTKLLDIGTGTGTNLELLFSFYKQAEGIDLSRQMLGLARTRLAKKGIVGGHVRLGDMHDLPFHDNEFDAVIMVLALHFSDQPERAIKEALRVLNQQGFFIMVDFIAHTNEELRTNQSHRRLGFDEDEIITMLRKYNPKIQLCETHLIKGEPANVNCLIYKTL